MRLFNKIEHRLFTCYLFPFGTLRLFNKIEHRLFTCYLFAFGTLRLFKDYLHILDIDSCWCAKLPSLGDNVSLWLVSAFYVEIMTNWQEMSDLSSSSLSRLLFPSNISSSESGSLLTNGCGFCLGNIQYSCNNNILEIFNQTWYLSKNLRDHSFGSKNFTQKTHKSRR